MAIPPLTWKLRIPNNGHHTIWPWHMCFNIWCFLKRVYPNSWMVYFMENPSINPNSWMVYFMENPKNGWLWGYHGLETSTINCCAMVPWPGQSRKSPPADLWPEDVLTDSSGPNLCGSVMEAVVGCRETFKWGWMLRSKRLNMCNFYIYIILHIRWWCEFFSNAQLKTEIHDDHDKNRHTQAL